MIAVTLFARCSDRYEDIANLDSQGTTIICFGNSITAGYEVASEEAFPALLGTKLRVPVINAGVVGDTTTDALDRIDRDVLAHDPRVVVVEFGGNDFIRRIDKEETFRNLDQLVGRITSHGAMVILLEIRIDILHYDHLADFKRVAENHGALLLRNFMSGILGNPKLTLDWIHPNAEGHKLIAERMLKELVPLLEAAEKRRAEKQ
ncbi:MAG: arylesterase [Candidatus Hydrogenedentota bacterium]|nr:MAG: arylesterase [Candidatus Hydrogenedentota bacterium]